VTPANITLEDDPQGEPGTVTTLYSGSEVMDIKAFYFGIIGVRKLLCLHTFVFVFVFKFPGCPGCTVLTVAYWRSPALARNRSLDCYPQNTTTNPFSRGLNSTSFDGGVIFFNVPPRLEPYTIVATKKGLVFSNASVWCQPGLLVRDAPYTPHPIHGLWKSS
jgi:hypothetical protein